MSKGFKIAGIEDVFREDVLRLISIMRRGLTRLSSHPEDHAALESVRATGHSLKGAASLVSLTQLSDSGALYERLAEVASSYARSEPEMAKSLYGAMLEGLASVERLLQLSLEHADEVTLAEVYAQLRRSFPTFVQGYLEPEMLDVARPSDGGDGHAAAEQPAAGQEEETFEKELAEIFALELQEHLANVPAELPRLSSPATRPTAAHKLNRIFHTIKGSSAMVGLSELSEAGKRLEKFFEQPHLLDTPAIQDAQKDLNRVFGFANLVPPDLAEWVAPAAARLQAEAPAGALDLERELLEAFNIDAAESIERIEQLLLLLEQQPEDREALRALFRQFHTLKGAAGAVGLDRAAAQLHEGESLLESVLAGAIPVESGRLIDFLFRLSDSIVALINQARGVTDPRRQVMENVEEAIAALRGAEIVAPVGEALAAEAAPAREARVVQEAETGVVRVQAARLDALLNQVGQLVVTRTRMDEKIQSFAELREKLDYCRTRLTDVIEGFQKRFEFTIGEPVAMPAAGAPEARGKKAGVDDFFTDLEFDKYDDFNILARSVIELATDTGEVADQLDDFMESLGEEVREFSKITSGLQRQITNLRLVPVDMVFRRLFRPVRDVARQENKLVELQVEGGEVQLDRGVIDALYTPLLHIVRNAVSHGIEPPALREARRKPRTGTVRVSARSRHNSVTIEVSDDGAGINYEAILAKAIQQKLVDPANPPPREQLLSLIFRPGFSTAEQVTDISGRGVGMDVVAEQVRTLNGSILVESKPNEGTTFRLALPITTSIDEVLLLESGSQLYALPVDFVERVIAIEPGLPALEQMRGEVQVDEEVIPSLLLGPLIGEPRPEAGGVGVVLRGGNQAMTLIVDQVRAQQEVVIRPLNRLLEAHPFLAASTTSGAGAIIFVLHVGRLFELVGAAEQLLAAPVEAAGAPEPTVARAVLVVDDSISVRKLAARFLESEGFEVDTAVDGINALEKLAEGRFRVVITDLEMPRMHGYDLVEAIRNSPRFAHLPVIVCTSRSSEKHRKRAREVGAQGYITKPFSKEEIIAEVLRVTEWQSGSAGATGTGE